MAVSPRLVISEKRLGAQPSAPTASLLLRRATDGDLAFREKQRVGVVEIEVFGLVLDDLVDEVLDKVGKRARKAADL